MPYIGNSLATQFQAFVTQTITGDGSTGYTLDRAVANGKELLVYINNVKQEEGSSKAYTASGTTITFSEAVASTDSCYVVFLGSAVQTVTAPDASIVSGQLANANLEMPNTLDMNGKELILDADGDTSITADTDDQIDFKIGGSDRVTIDSSGRVLIGTDSGDAFNDDSMLRLQRAGDRVFIHLKTDADQVSGILFGDVDDDVECGIEYEPTNKALTLSTNNNTEAVRIDSSGDILVAKTSSDSTVVGVELKALGQVVATRDGGQSGTFARLSSDGEIVRFKKDSTTIGTLGSDGSDFVIDGGTNHTGLRFGTISVTPRDNGTATDNANDFGSSANRWDDIFATNGTINTSDQNEKQDIASATTKELNVAKKLSSLFKTFRWKDKVAEKGDKARTHTGIIAQEIQSSFSAEGLDASKYGLFISDTWWEKEIKVDAVEEDEEKGIEGKEAHTYMDIKEEKTDGYTERTRLGVRYPELFSFIFSSIEARLTALESK